MVPASLRRQATLRIPQRCRYPYLLGVRCRPSWRRVPFGIDERYLWRHCRGAQTLDWEAAPIGRKRAVQSPRGAWFSHVFHLVREPSSRTSGCRSPKSGGLLLFCPVMAICLNEQLEREGEAQQQKSPKRGSRRIKKPPTWRPRGLVWQCRILTRSDVLTGIKTDTAYHGNR